MKYIFTLFFLTTFSFFVNGQIVEQTISIPNDQDCVSPIKGASCNPGAPSIMNGNGSLGMTYNNTACGLNYAQASNMTTTRYTPNPGTGFPTTLTISGIPNCATIEQAYVWWGCSNSSVDASFTFNGAPMTGALIGSGAHKCWSLGGTENYRGDVTAAVTGNGAYTFSSPIGTGVDGVTLMIIYSDPNATYQGTIQLNDGDITNNSGGSSSETMTGLNVCANSTFGQAFTIVGDMQDNITPPTHTATHNGVGTSFPNLFWNFDISNTNFTAGQTTSNFGMVPDGGGDCYDWVLMGVYYQTTSCVTCTPPPGMTSTTSFADATCGNCDGTATINPSGGTTPYTFAWDNGGTTQTITGLCAGTYICTAIDASGCLQVTDTVIVSSTGGAGSPVITPAGPFCTVDAALNLSVAPTGGTWAGTGITNTTNGTFDPATAGTGSHQIIYTESGACPGADTITIIVNSNADATINGVGPFCVSGSSLILTAIDPGGIWSGNGITNTATGAFDPNTAGVGTHTITYGITGSCGDTQTVNIVIDPDLDATITPVAPLCPLDPSINLVGATAGGTWSGTGITNTTNGTFDPTTAGIGTHTITYSVTGMCGDTQTVNITVTSALDATITPAGPFCESSPAAILTAVDPGGTWSGNGITNAATGAFDPNIAGPGNHTITYGIPGGCGDTTTTVIDVIADADATITPVTTMCIADAPINLVAVDPNGTWSGNGITNATTGTFDPATAGTGNHTITYTISGACGDVQTTTITVVSQDDATITAAGPFCIDAGSVNLTSVTAGGVWSGTGITNPTTGTFNPTTAGAGTHTITYTTPGACGNTDTEDIIVYPLPNVVFTVDTLSLCETPAQPFEFSTDTSGGLFSSILWDFGDNNTGINATESHTYAGPGIYDVTLALTSSAATGSCTNSSTQFGYVQVFANPTASFTSAPNPTTMFAPTVHFYDQSYTNITNWDWNFGGLGASTNSNPIFTFPEDTGSYLTSLIVTDMNGCINSTSEIIIVKGEYGIYIPNSFTPDFDGLNDGFSPYGFGISDKNYSFFIFDRWGELIFETYTKFEPWNGTYKNTLVPNDIYVWQLNFTDINGVKHTQIGHVSIVK